MTSVLSPLTLRSGVTLKNRLALAPLTNGQSADDGTLEEAESRWLLRRARGGFGLVSTCAAMTSLPGKAFDGQLGVYDDVRADACAPLARGIADAGALGIAQLVHGGARSPSRLTGRQPVAPTAFHEDSPAFEDPRALTAAELVTVHDEFVAAAVRCQRAGFGGVELHAAHGYLLSQFLSRTMNTRADGYGTDLVGRARLLRELTRAVRAACGPSFVVGVRVSPEDRGNAKGLDLDETVQVCRWLADDGACFVHLSVWDYTKPAKDGGAHAIARMRAALPKDVAIVAAGGVWTKDDAACVMDLGADVVSVGRAAIFDPDWPAHVAKDGLPPVRGPRTAQELIDVDVSARFFTYLKRFPGLVADPN